MTSADNPALRETTHRWLGSDVEHDTCCECGWSCQNGDGNLHACARDHVAHVAALRETRQKEQPTPQDEDDIFACRVCDDPNGDGERTVLHTECLDALKSRIAEARNEALEEAAKIIDETMKNLHIEMQKEPVYVQWARNGGAGTAIRALKSGAGRS